MKKNHFELLIRAMKSQTLNSNLQLKILTRFFSGLKFLLAAYFLYIFFFSLTVTVTSPPKKTSENKDYCKRYREKNRETYWENDAERKRAQRVKIKLQDPELYELKKKEERERKQLSRLRKKLGRVD